MRRQFTIPLSYNPIAPEQLAQKLNAYAHRHHDDIITDFELGLAKSTGARHVVAMNSGTAAIHLGLKTLGVVENDVVLVSSFTYVATVNPVLYLKAIPVFVDSEPETWNMDPILLEQAIQDCLKQGKKPKVILVVHTYGMPARMDKILEISRKHGIAVLEDAAEAIGSSYGGKPLGTFGDVGILSFNNNKILTSYGGGALLTNNAAISEKVLQWSTQSRDNQPYNEHSELGYNYRMGPVNAAIGMVALENLKNNVLARRSIFDSYRKEFQHIPGIGFQSDITPTSGDQNDSFSNRWITCVLLKNNLAKIRQSLDASDIETRPLWKPMHLQPLFKNCQAFVNGTSERLFNEGMCLPSGNTLTRENIKKVVRHFRG